MVIDSDSFLYFGLEQGLFCGGPIPPAQQLPSDAYVQLQQYQFQSSAPMPVFQFADSHLLQPPKCLPTPDFSVLSQEDSIQHQLQYPAVQLKPSFQLPPEPLQFYKNIFETAAHDLSKGHNPFLERLSSPDGSVSTGSDQGYFDMMSEDEYTYFPGDSSYSPAMATFGAESDFLIKPIGQFGVPVMTEGQPSSPVAIPGSGLRGCVPHLAHESFSPASYSSASASHTSSLPALSSPLKQQLTGYVSDESSDSDEDDSKPTRKKRVRKTMKAKTPAKPKGLKPVLRCEFHGCKITCSSIPSLARHFETHKWRGKYSPNARLQHHAICHGR
ncbi:hypothetical protein BGZ72_000364 [Mortierella alpina]|nr:hypothetical protein BGZ72_000364 [Mortierella alpina]